MRPFRMMADPQPGRAFAVEVIGHRQDLPDPVSFPRVTSWFAFHFHHPCVVGTAAGEAAVPADSVLLVAPGEPVAHRPQCGRLERSWIRCTGRAAAAAVAESGLATRRPYLLAGGDDALAALLALHRACTHPRGAPSGLQLALFRTWLHTVARDAGPGSASDGGVEAARRHVERTYLLPQRLDRLADLAGLSRSQLCRGFRRSVGLSPIQYALRLRLEAACELLLGGERGIAAIAQACGFADRYHFSRAFSARYGMGPAAWRQRPPADAQPG
jgi:AraC-like DNA-binding protein